MAATLPPFPANSPPGSWAWTDWWKKLQNYINEVTKVAQTGNSDLDSSLRSGISGYTGLIDIKWAAVANYCEFYATFPVDPFIPLQTVSAWMDLGPHGANIGLPPAVGDGLLVCSAFNANGAPATPGPAVPYVQSLGVGYITVAGGFKAFLPDFTVPAGAGKKITITGRYNTQ